VIFSLYSPVYYYLKQAKIILQIIFFGGTMAYKTMNTDKLFEIYRRWQDNQSNSRMERATGIDRKTIRNYLKTFPDYDLIRNDFHDEEEVKKILQIIINDINSRKSNSSIIWKKHHEEIKNMLSDIKNPFDLQSIYDILVCKYDVKSSYSSLRRYVIKSGIRVLSKKIIYRIEMPPGKETQIDYGKVGRHPDVSGKNRDIYAFCGILSSSRRPYIEFVYKQNETSFTESNARMFEHFGGVTETVNLDNLKSGVIIADGTNPVFNKTYAELANHYRFFIDPSRVSTPTDKGKIERFVPTARRLFHRLKYLYPNVSLVELNKKALEWCDSVYSNKKHGSTGVEPMIFFKQFEKEKLKALPGEKFYAVKWKKAKVHPDQFIQFETKRYSLPPQYRGAEVWIKKKGKMIHIYHESKHIRQFIIPNKNIIYEKTDFPEDTAQLLKGGYPKYILKKARSINDAACKLITQIMTPHANLTARRAAGVLNVLEKYYRESEIEEIIYTAIDQKIDNAKDFKKLYEREKIQMKLDQVISEGTLPSTSGSDYTRSSSYYFN
jgi:hypothetical protein